MTEKADFKWTAAYWLRYPRDVQFSWEQIAKLLLDGLKDYGPATRHDRADNGFTIMFGVNERTEQEALHSSRKYILDIVRDERLIYGGRVIPYQKTPGF